MRSVDLLSLASVVDLVAVGERARLADLLSLEDASVVDSCGGMVTLQSDFLADGFLAVISCQLSHIAIFIFMGLPVSLKTSVP